MRSSAPSSVSATPEAFDMVDDGNCQTDMQTPGMMTGDAQLPPKLARSKAQHERQADRSQFAQALADALRGTTNEAPK